MHFRIHTLVAGDIRTVFEKCDETLFLRIKPFFIGLKVLRFDGCRPGDEVHLEMTILGRKQIWISRVTELRETPDEIAFTDEGVRLPWFLRSWKHRHRIVRSQGGSVLVDDLTYQSPFQTLGWLLFPVLYLQFYLRKHRYRAFFAAS
jgi:ligand-binding SRPBCC domain-containing protein